MKPKDDQERYERWRAVLKALSRDEVVHMMQQMVHEVGPMSDAEAKAFRERLTPPVKEAKP